MAFDGAGRGYRPARWLGKRRAAVRALIAMAAGASMTLAQPPVSVPWVLFAAVPVLLLLIGAARTGLGAAVAGWAAGFGYFVSGLHWMGHAFLVDPDRFAWLLPLAVTGLPAFLAFFWAGAFALARALAPYGGMQAVAGFAVALTLAEALRGHVLTGFPWALPAYAWVETPVIQSVAWIGSWGLTLLTLVFAGAPLLLRRKPALVAAGAAGLAAVGLMGGAWLDRPLPAGEEMPVVRIVQPNAEQHLKWLPGHRERFAARLEEGSSTPPDPDLGPPDLVAWPETALTFLPQDAPDRLAQAAGSAGGATLVTGTLYYDRPGDGRRIWYNSLVAAGPDGRPLVRYDKHHLVPFGEYLPFRPLLEALGLAALAGMESGGLAPGPGPRVIDLPGLPSFAPAICYEMIFPQGILPGGERPAFILHLTNDGWFGRFAGPQQHLAQARIRAIEQGLPVVRAANTGISAVIDARGQMIEQLPLGTHGHLDARLPPALPPTPYAMTGDWPALGLTALLGLVLALVSRATLDRSGGLRKE